MVGLGASAGEPDTIHCSACGAEIPKNAIKQLCRRAAEAPTPRQLKESIRHVAYEVAAMERAFFLYASGRRFCFEAFLIHVRQLREFYWSPDSEHENGLYAKHYFDPPTTWTDRQGRLSQTLEKTKDRIDRQLAHLARDRHGDFTDLEPERTALKAEIMAQWNRFLDALPADTKQSFVQAYHGKVEALSTSSG